MSAFVCSEDHFKALAIFAAARGNGFGGNSRVNPVYLDRLSDAEKQLDGARLAELYADILYDENLRSVGARYPNEGIDDLPGFDDKPDRIEITGYDMARPAYLRLKPVDILKMCDCLEYQSCETDDYRKTLGFKLLNKIRSAAICDLPGYEDAPWDFCLPEKACST